MTNPDQFLPAQRLFASQFGQPATCFAAAPGRVNLIGEHIDYNDGIVLPFAIEHYTVIAARPNDRQALRIYSDFNGERLEIQTDLPPKRCAVPWQNYLRGVLAGFQKAGGRVAGFDAVIVSQIPVGSGLSSSAALEVAFLTLLEGLSDIEFTGVQKAQLCQAAEHQFAQVPCGIMDQIASIHGRSGHLIALDCLSLQLDFVRWHDPATQLLVINTNAPHRLVDGEYRRRREQCNLAKQNIGIRTWRELTMDVLQARQGELDEVQFRRARHVVTEIERCRRTIRAIRDGQLDLAGQQLYLSHQSLRDDYQVSCAELDFLVDRAQAMGPAAGVYGMRMTGGGFGGCTVSIVTAAQAERVARSVCDAYQQAMGIKADWFLTSPATGAFFSKNHPVEEGFNE